MTNISTCDAGDPDCVFRLLLERAPTTAEHAHLAERAGAGLTQSALAREIVATDEFMQRHGMAVAPVAVDMGGYCVYALPNDEHIGAPLIAGHAYEPYVAAVFEERLQAGDCMLDVGANIGIFTMHAAHRVGPAGRVIAVEPIESNRQLIHAAQRQNGFAQVEVIAAAASDRRELIELRTHVTTSNSATPAAAGPRLRSPIGGRTVLAPTVLLDDALAMLPRLDLVKIDIEGMEPRALRGLRATLARLRPALITEFHPQAIEHASAESPVDYLRGLLELYPGITVLEREGDRRHCARAEDVMLAWADANRRHGLGGELHLDLLLAPC